MIDGVSPSLCESGLVIGLLFALVFMRKSRKSSEISFHLPVWQKTLTNRVSNNALNIFKGVERAEMRTRFTNLPVVNKFMSDEVGNPYGLFITSGEWAGSGRCLRRKPAGYIKIRIASR